MNVIVNLFYIFLNSQPRPVVGPPFISFSFILTNQFSCIVCRLSILFILSKISLYSISSFCSLSSSSFFESQIYKTLFYFFSFIVFFSFYILYFCMLFILTLSSVRFNLCVPRRLFIPALQ